MSMIDRSTTQIQQT